MASLPTTNHEHHDIIDAQLDKLPGLAEMLGEKPLSDEFRRSFAELIVFIHDSLVPHMNVVEASVYPELERLMQNRHSMVPMRREHEELSGLLSALDDYRAGVEADELGQSGEMGLRRVLYRLYALAKVHLAEEDEYLGVLEHNLSEGEQDVVAASLEHAVTQPL